PDPRPAPGGAAPLPAAAPAGPDRAPGLAPERERVLPQPLQPLPGLLEFIAERVGVHLEQLSVAADGLRAVARVHAHPVVAEPAGQAHAPDGAVGAAGVHDAQLAAQVQHALGLVLVAVAERRRSVLPLLDRELYPDVLLSAGNEHLVPAGADQRVVGRQGTARGVRVNRWVVDPEHTSLREDWDLQPKQPAAHPTPPRQDVTPEKQHAPPRPAMSLKPPIKVRYATPRPRAGGSQERRGGLPGAGRARSGASGRPRTAAILRP